MSELDTSTIEDLGRYRVVVMVIAILASYLIALNTTVLGLALPSIGADLGVDGAHIDWVITTYLIALAVSLPATGWLADRFGRRPTFIWSLALFSLGAVIAVTAPNLAVLLVGRIVQGLGGGALLPLSLTMVYELFPPHRRGTAIGIWGVAIAAAPALGPPAGGWLLTVASWRWIFVGLLVIALLAMGLAMRYLRELVTPSRPPLDAPGWMAVAITFGGLVVLSRNAAAWGYTSWRTLVLAVLILVVAALLVRRSLRIDHPLLELRTFANRTFSVVMLLMAMVSMAQFAKLNFLPVELQVIREMSTLDVGMLLAPSGVAVSLSMPLGGNLTDRLGPRAPVIAGLLVTALGTAVLATLQADTTLTMLLVAVIVQGFGSGLLLSPLQVTAMSSVRPHLVAHASAITQLNRQVSAAVATAIMAAMLVAQVGSMTPPAGTAAEVASAQAGYNSIFVLATGVLLVGLLPALALPGRRATRRHRADAGTVPREVPAPKWLRQ